MFTPSKPTSTSAFDVTILSTPQPQASSTVQRKNTLESRYSDRDVNKRNVKDTAAHQVDTTRTSNASSLGILDNISSFLTEVSEMDIEEKHDESKLDVERELARRLLQKCSNFTALSTAPETNKENDVNVQNLTENISSSIVSNQKRVPQDNKDISLQDNVGKAVNKTSATSVIFEPNEITARSSGLSRSSDKNLLSFSDKETNAISFNTTTAEIMAQFGNEEFRSASQMASQMLADEASWEQNCSYAIPTTRAAGKEYLDLSCFSGIIGELDLSVESCAGHKMSVDEFFRRKCGNIGGLLDGGVDRPSIGLSVKSPKRKEKLVPLVDTSIMTEASSVISSCAKKTTQPVANMTKDIQEQSIMSLSSIAQALQDIDSCTPRRLVDQLIMAKKKRKSLQMQGQNILADTYTLLPSDRKSMPATTSLKTQGFENSTNMSHLSAKLSLDSKTLNETTDVKGKIPRILSFESELDVKTQDNLTPACSQQALKKEMNNKSVMCLYDQNLDLKKLLEDSNLPVKEDSSAKLSPRHSLQLSAKLAKEKNSNIETPEIRSKGVIKQENISYKSKTDSTIYEESNSLVQTSNVVIGRNTEELCNCIVGVLRETDIELLNKSDRWIICSLNLNQIQGDRQNIELKLPEDVILIKPNAARFVKIGAKVIKMGKPVITVLNVTVSDMVTRSEWAIKHIICFKPEELNVHIPLLSKAHRLDFRSLVENCSKTLAITFENRNSLKIPIKLSITQDGPKVFSIENTLNKESNINEHSSEFNFVAQPQEIITVNIKCKGILSTFGQVQERYKHHYEGKLLVQMPRNNDHALTIAEIPIVVEVGTCKIELIDTEVPITIPSKQNKTLSIINRGSMPISVSASVRSDDEHANDIKDFLITPETLLVKCDEIGVFNIAYKPQMLNVSKRNAKINLIAGGNVYCYSIAGGQHSLTETENDNFLRCETPQYLSSVSSPTSPQSVSSNSRSEFCGRNSPSSSVSGSTVVGDKIPIRATHAALAWNSVKAGKSEIKEFTIRNTSNNKIKIQALISDNDKSFKFIRDGQAVSTGMLLVLQRTESRTLSIMFSPHRVGAAAGKIIFRHYEPRKNDSESRPSKVIFLYGYGGYGKVEISEAFKDMSGKMWLSLGTLTSGSSLNAKIKLQNTGDLHAYAKIKLTPKALYPTMVSSWNVNPTELLLKPKEVQWVTLEFHPRKEDLVLLQRSDVSHVGTVTIIHGDEPTRWRIRRLCNKMKEIGELSGSESEAFRSTVHPICKAFPREQQMSDINIIRDSTQNLGELCRGVCQHEIMLTTEVCPDETLSVLHDNPDDSQMFYSLCSDNSHMYDGSGESFLPFETTAHRDMFRHEDCDDHFTVSPLSVVLNPPMKSEAIVTILSSCNVAQPFETKLSNTEYLSVIPAEGMIPARRDFPLRIQCKQRMERNLETMLEIYTENNKKDVHIKVNCKK